MQTVFLVGRFHGVKINFVNLICGHIEVVLILTVKSNGKLPFANGKGAFGLDDAVEYFGEPLRLEVDLLEILLPLINFVLPGPGLLLGVVGGELFGTFLVEARRFKLWFLPQLFTKTRAEPSSAAGDASCLHHMRQLGHI